MEIAETQLRPKVSYAQLFPWPESDAEFLRKLIIHNKKLEQNPNPSYSPSELCFCHEGFLMRQKFLRSYPFTAEETVFEATNEGSKKVHEKTKTKSKSDKGLRSFFRFFKLRIFKSGTFCHPEDEVVAAGKASAVHPLSS